MNKRHSTLEALPRLNKRLFFFRFQSKVNNNGLYIFSPTPSGTWTQCWVSRSNMRIPLQPLVLSWAATRSICRPWKTNQWGEKCLILCYQWLENKYLRMSKALEDCWVFAQAVRESE